MTQQQNLPALPDGFGTGLEDFRAEDAVIPRLTIVHDEGRFKDNLSGETFESVNAILLGLVKQRVLWHPEVGDSDPQPMCKSTDNQVGHPNTDAPKGKRFPWDKAGFDPADYPEQPDGLIDLPCAACKLKEWGTHPNGKSPWCTEQWTLPILYDGWGSDQFMPAILTLQRSGVQAIRAYLTSFQRSGSPAFVNIATLILDLNRRGSVDYSTPRFQRGPETDVTEWPSYAAQFMQIREYLTRRPVNEDDIPVEAGANNTNTAPAQVQQQQQPQQTQQPAPTPEPEPEPAPAAPPAPSQPAPTPSEPATQPSASADDDDLPF